MGVKFKFTVEDYDAISFILGKMIKKTKLLDTIAYVGILISWIWLVYFCLSKNNTKSAIIYSVIIFIIAGVYAYLSKESMQKKITHIRNARLLKKKRYKIYISEQQVELKENTITHTILNKKLVIKINTGSNIIIKENYIFIYSDTKKRLLNYDMSPKAPCIVIPRSVFSSLCKEKEFIKNITDNINRVKES